MDNRSEARHSCSFRSIIVLFAVGFMNVASGQVIEASVNSTVVPIGGSLDFTLERFEAGTGNELTDVIGGYLYISNGVKEFQPLTFIKIPPTNKLEVYSGISDDAPQFVGRVTVPRDKVMRVRNFTLADLGLQFVFRLTYKESGASKTLTSNVLESVITVFRYVTVNASSNVTAIESERNLVINCTSSGVPTPNIQWSKDDGELPDTVQVSYDSSLHVNVSLLAFPILGRNDRGVYRCAAQNVGGSGAQSFSLAVKSAPGIVLVSTKCEDGMIGVCWSSPNDTVDSQASLYTLTLSNGMTRNYTIPSCLPGVWYANITKFNATIVASNQYGSSPIFTGSFEKDVICSGATQLATVNIMVALYSTVAVALLYN